MARNIERKIREVEDFNVRIMDNGKDVRGDKDLPNQYSYERKLPNSKTVKEWKELRFYKFLAGYEVEVLYADGNKAVGQTSLETVRSTYI
jgi:hypothetical protein